MHASKYLRGMSRCLAASVVNKRASHLAAEVARVAVDSNVGGML